MLMTAQLDTGTANKAVADGTMPKLLENMIAQVKPEAVYFTPTDGQRSCLIVFDMTDASQMPAVSEPFFQAGAKVSLRPVMNLEDLRTGLASLDRPSSVDG
jgi:hypothetical protein